MDNLNKIDGVILTPLKKVFNPMGDVLHAIKKSDDGFLGFGEAYFSTIKYNQIKPWKKHLQMTLNFIIPKGNIRIVIYDDRLYSNTKNNYLDFTLGEDNYQRVTIPADLWVAFMGVDRENILLNIANLEHDPNEVIKKTNLSDIPYSWTSDSNTNNV
jgi:dTDP-4-dehydrorhamnose 3,5-epimerase